MVGDFGTTSDFHTKKKPPTLATFDFQSTQRLSGSLATIDYQNFPDASDYQIFTHPATMKQTRKNSGSEIPRHNRTSVLVYSYIHNKKDTFYSVSNML